MESAVSTPLDPVVPTYPVKRFTADQYVEMIHAGILTAEDHVELIDGVITEMAPAGEEHTWGTTLLVDVFAAALPTHYLLVQGTARISEVDMLDPDVALVRRRGSEQRREHPKAEDIDLAIEVAKSSLKSDSTRKAAAYAKAGIAEYWIVDLQNRRMLVHTQPMAEGYADVQAHQSEATLAPLAFPGISVRVGDIVGG